MTLAALFGSGLVPIGFAFLILDPGANSTARQVLSAHFGVAGGLIVLFVFGARLIIDGGLVPRLWIKRDEQSVVIWSGWSVLRGLSVSADAARPLRVRTSANRSPLPPRVVTSGWMTLDDGRRRLSIVAYTSDPDAFFRRLVARLEREGVPLVRT